MKSIDFKKIFNSFDHFKVIIIGDVMIDSYMWGNVDRISPEAPIPIIASTKKETRLGGAANVALNIQSLGATPILCSVIGNIDKSNIFFELLKKQNISSEGILVDNNRITTIKTRIISNNQHLLRVDEEDDNYLSAKFEKQLVKYVSQIMSETKINAVIFQDYDKGVITPFVIEKIINLSNKLSIPTLVDPKKRNFHHYKNITLFKPNFKEFAEGLKIDLDTENFVALFEAAKKFQSTSNIKFVFITLSARGIFISDKHSYKVIPAQRRDIADISGAGDTVISTVTLCLAAGLQPEEIAKISNLAGGYVCEKVGVVPVNKEQLLKECISIFG